MESRLAIAHALVSCKSTSRMQAEVIVALVAAGAALLVSVSAGVTQLLQLRTKQRLDLKIRNSQLDEQAAIVRSEELRTALREACKALQRVQDEILLFLKSAPERIDSKVQHHALINARNNLLDVYREYHAILDAEDRRHLEDARKEVVDIVLALELRGVWDDKTPWLDHDVLGQLGRANDSLLSHHQHLLLSAVHESTLRFSRTERLIYGE